MGNLQIVYLITLNCLTFTSIISCQNPVILKRTLKIESDYNCEFTVDSKIIYTDMNSFINDLGREVKKKSRSCKCDTVYVDIDNMSNMRKKTPDLIWGICKSTKWTKKLNNK